MRPALYGRNGQAWAEARDVAQLSMHRTVPTKNDLSLNANSFEAEKPGLEGGREGKTGNEVVEVEAGPARQAALEIVTGISQKNRNNDHSSS